VVERDLGLVEFPTGRGADGHGQGVQPKIIATPRSRSTSMNSIQVRWAATGQRVFGAGGDPVGRHPALPN